MFEPTQREVDRDVESFMKAFERSQVGEVAAAHPRRPQHVLLVLDASSQDATGIALAQYFAETFDCRVSVVDARDSVESQDLVGQVAKQLNGVECIKGSGDAFQQVLDAVAQVEPDLVVVPCPFGRDLKSVGPDSVGTVIDVLLARLNIPMLVVREPFEQVGQAFERLLLMIIGENEVAPLAAGWAAGLVAKGGRCDLVLVLEQEFFENMQDVLAAIDPEVTISPESVEGAMAASQTRLHRSLQIAARENDFEHDLFVLRENEPQATAMRDDPRHPLLVLALERADHASQGMVRDWIRWSANPVFIVPPAVGE